MGVVMLNELTGTEDLRSGWVVTDSFEVAGTGNRIE